MDELTVISDELKNKVKAAGACKLDQAQLAIFLDIPDADCRMLMLQHPELNKLYRQGELDIAMKQLATLKDMADNPEHRNQFQAAKMLYEIYSGRQTGPSTVVVNQTINNSNLDRNMKLLEVLDAETVEAIAND